MSGKQNIFAQNADDLAKKIDLLRNIEHKFDNSDEIIFKEINQEIENSKTDIPANAFWQSTLADYLNSYKSNYYYKISQRSHIENVTIENINEWDTKTFDSEIKHCYISSLQNADVLMNIDAEDYRSVLAKNDKINLSKFSFFDVLANRAVEYLSYSLMIDDLDSSYIEKLWDYQEFLKLSLEISENNSNFYNILAIYQTILNHYSASNDEMFTKISIEYFDFLRENSIIPDRTTTWYIIFLSDFAKRFNEQDAECIAMRIANLYTERYSKSSESNPEYNNDLLKAVAIYDKIISNKKSEYYDEACTNRYKITHPQIRLGSFQNYNGVDEPFLYTLSYRNIYNAYLKIYPITENHFSILNNRQNNRDEIWKIFSENKPVYSEKLNLTDNHDYLTNSSAFSIQGLKSGMYLLVISENEIFNYGENVVIQCFQVSDFVVEQNYDAQSLLILDRKTGAPCKNAKVTVASKSGNYSVLSDKNGIAKLKKVSQGNDYNIIVEHNGQNFYYSTWLYWQEDDSFKRLRMNIFTDRKLYRPGQKVHYKVIACAEQNINGETQNLEILQNTEFQVTLMDVNNREIACDTLKTNENGSFSGTFELPEGGLTGKYHIQTKIIGKSVFSRYNDIYYHYFSVEEYKRPTFEVAINEPENAIKLGDNVKIEGLATAYAGYPISNAEVSYSVVRKVNYYWFKYFQYNDNSEIILSNGTTKTDENGKFTFDFNTLADKYSKNVKSIYRFEIKIVATDINGETYETEKTILISNREKIINANIPEQITKNSDKNEFPISITNVYDKPQSGKINYEIFKLTTPEKFFHQVDYLDNLSVKDDVKRQFPFIAFNKEYDKNTWKSTSISYGEINVEKEKDSKFSIPDLKSLESGCYKIIFKSEDDEYETITHIYDQNDKKCSGYEAIWANIPASVAAGENLEIEFGTYIDNANILVTIAHNDKIIENKWHKIDKSVKKISVPTKNDCEGSITIGFIICSNGFTYQQNHNVYIVNKSHNIDFEFVRFRDKTTPGSNEEYQIRLKNSKGQPISAELLCEMYDYSLATIGGANYYSLNLKRTYRHYSQNFYPIQNVIGISYNNFIDYFSYGKINLQYPEFNNIFPFTVFGNLVCENAVFFSEDNEVGAAVAKSRKLGASYSITANDDELDEEEVLEEQNVELIEQNTNNPTIIRTNFNETAFFYPNLQTDKNGDIIVKFTVPEALTKWHLQGVAHNNQLMSGVFSKFVQTSKDVMIVPNAPRFLREGDTLNFSAKVVNMSEQKISGYVDLQLFDTQTGKEIDIILSQKTQNYEIEKGLTQEVLFEIAVPEDVVAITYRIIAHNNNPQDVVGDGEEKILPVLPNRMLVTETMPFYISGLEDKTFTFNKLQESFTQNASKSLKNYRLTVECTPNPIWYAIQALPYMMEYPYECAEQKFSRYYANALATHILKSNPAIESVFNKWKSENPDAFCSALEKNQELKQLVLEETPWVLDAQRESANKQNVALLFDFERMSNEEAKIINQLAKSQNADGGWSWFDGGKSNSFITAHIVAGFGHLKTLGVQINQPTDFLNNAVQYLDKSLYERYLEIKEKAIYHPNEIHYLYARSFYNNRIDARYDSAYKYYYAEVLKNWKSQSYYAQAMIALIAWRNNDQKIAREILDYLKSMAQHDEEMGMFWKRQGGGCFWYEQPIERQAMLIEAFSTITPEDANSVSDMQQWLLKQKQTQHWGTTKSTTEAVYALLVNSNLEVKSDNVKLKIGNEILPNQETESEFGTGYFKKSFSKNEISADKSSIKIEKNDNGIAWGGIYWQYFENLDEITSSDYKNLKIEKEIFKVVNTDKGEVLRNITENEIIQVGDKVRVRIVISTDRDFEYVHLKDQRAAAFEPVNVLSQYKYQDGLWYYESTRDASTNFFIDYMPKGKYVFEYTVFATQKGDFSNGITQIECMYAPEFQSHSQGIRVEVK